MSLIIESKADLHLHSNLSDGADSPEELVKKASRRNLRVVAVTDHDTLAGAFTARRFVNANPQLRVEVLLGFELTTRCGHLLCYFPDPTDYVKPKELLQLTPVDVVQEVIKHQGLVVVPHPGYLINSFRFGDPIFYYAQGVEVHNGAAQSLRCIPPVYVPNGRVAQFAARFPNLALVGGSDAHEKEYLGCMGIRFRGETTSDLVDAIERRIIRPYFVNGHLPDFASYLRMGRIFWQRFGARGLFESLRNRPFVKVT